MKTRFVYVSAAFALFAAALVVAPVQANHLPVKNWTLNLNGFEPPLGILTVPNQLNSLGVFESRLSDVDGVGGLDTQTTEMELSLPYCFPNFVDFCVTDTDHTTDFLTPPFKPDFEITAYLRTKGTIILPISLTGQIATIHSEGTLKLVIDKTPEAAPFRGGGGGMAGPDDIDGVGTDDWDEIVGVPAVPAGNVVNIATFTLKVDGELGSQFDINTNIGWSKATFELTEAMPGYLFDENGEDLASRLPGSSNPAILSISNVMTDADTDNNGILDTTFSAGLFSLLNERCENQKLEKICGVLEGSFKLEEEDPGAVTKITLGDRVWTDLNGDGIQNCEDTNGNGIIGDIGDEGLECEGAGFPDLRVELLEAPTSGDCLELDPDAVPFMHTMTGPDGFYEFEFDELSAVDYCLRWEKPIELDCTLLEQSDPSQVDPKQFDSDGVPLDDTTCGTAEGISLDPGDDDRSWDLGLVQPCSITLNKTCAVAASSDDLLCQARIEATTLLYVGAKDGVARVEIRGKDAGLAIYPSVDLMSGVTELSVDAETGDGLGSRTNIDIFFADSDVLNEVIHTSCSAMYEVGKRAPLDAASPNLPFGGAKGDPSPNWFVVNFVDRDGDFVEQPGPGTPEDACTVPFGGADVTYAYDITNVGSTDVLLTSLSDDMLDMVGLPPQRLASGDKVSTSIVAFIETYTENTATATANVFGNTSLQCPVTNDMVTVTVAAPPPASCRDAKPITTAALIWNENRAVDVMTEAGELFEGIQPGNRISIQRGSAGHDVNVAIFDATNGARIGTSSFHLSCSDDGMNGVEDCDTSQGNGKRDDPALNNNWILDGMGGENGLFDCALANTGTVAPSPNGPADGVFGSFLGPKVTKDKLKWKLNNNGPETVYVTGVKVTWPAEQGNLKHLRLGRHNLTGEVSAAPPVAEFDVTDLVADGTKRAIESNRREELKAHFKLDYEGDSVSDYTLEIRFNNGETVAFP